MFKTENFFQYLFIKFPDIENAVRRSFNLDEGWSVKNADEINAILNRWPRKTTIEVDSGLMDRHQNILPIELETTPKAYTLVQVPHYCYRARYNSYRLNQVERVPYIRTLMISIGIDREKTELLNGPSCDVRAIHPTDPKYTIELEEDENPVFHSLQTLLKNWDEEYYHRVMDSVSIPLLGKVFITCWILILGDQQRMAEIEASIKKIIDEKFGSEEEFIDETLAEEGVEVIKLFKPEQIRGLTTRQLRALTNEQIKALTNEQIKALTNEQIEALTDEQIEALTDEQIEALTDEQIEALTDKQLKALTEEQIRSLDEKHINMITIDQLSKVDPEKLREALDRAERKE